MILLLTMMFLIFAPLVPHHHHSESICILHDDEDDGPEEEHPCCVIHESYLLQSGADSYGACLPAQLICVLDPVEISRNLLHAGTPAVTERVSADLRRLRAPPAMHV